MDVHAIHADGRTRIVDGPRDADGTVSVGIGGVVSRLTERVTWAVFPATSRATTVIVFGPSPRRIVRLKAPVVGFTPVVAPFTVTVAPTSVVPETLVVAIRVRA